jgi:hypothetical protein
MFAPATTRGRPQQLNQVGSIRKQVAWVVPEGQHWLETTKSEYWAGCLRQLEAGDEVIIHSSDRQVKFTIHVLAVNAHAGTVDMDFTAIRLPEDVTLPPPTIAGVPQYRLRQNAHAQFEIVDTEGAIVADGLLDRDAAERAMAALARSDGSDARSVAELGALSHKPAAAAPNDRPPYRVLPSSGGLFHVIAVDSGNVVSKRNMPLPEAEADAAARNDAVRRIPAPAAPSTDDAASQRAIELAQLGRAEAQA